MLSLQEELASTENKIAFSRQFYNDEVMRYDTLIQSIPTNLIANNFRPDSWVRKETGDEVTPAYQHKSLRMLFKEGKTEKLSKLLCPHCHLELCKMLYEDVPVKMCSYYQGVLLEESKENSNG